MAQHHQELVELCSTWEQTEGPSTTIARAPVEVTQSDPSLPLRPKETAEAPLALSTSLTSMARAGDKVLQVVSARGMKIGDKIRVGNSIVSEEATIAGFGSIHLQNPLVLDHQVGELVTVVTPVAAVPRVRLDDVHDDDDSDSDARRPQHRDETSDSSHSIWATYQGVQENGQNSETSESST